jgi:hypothetical protein
MADPYHQPMNGEEKEWKEFKGRPGGLFVHCAIPISYIMIIADKATQHRRLMMIAATEISRQFLPTCLFSGFGSLFQTMNMMNPMMMLKNEIIYSIHFSAPSGSCGG